MSVKLTDQERIERLQRENEQLRARVNDTEGAASIAFVTMAEAGTLDDTTVQEYAPQFIAWASGMAVSVGALRRYDGNGNEPRVYRCVQAHTTQADWTPDVATSLWSLVGDPGEEYPAWAQPIGAHDAYALGDKVSHGGKHWESSAGANVWEPGVYGWVEVA